MTEQSRAEAEAEAEAAVEIGAEDGNVEGKALPWDRDPAVGPQKATLHLGLGQTVSL